MTSLVQVVPQDKFSCLVDECLDIVGFFLRRNFRKRLESFDNTQSTRVFTPALLVFIIRPSLGSFVYAVVKPLIIGDPVDGLFCAGIIQVAEPDQTPSHVSGQAW